MIQWAYIIVSIALAVVPEFCLFLWWASNLSTRIKQLETDKDRLYAEVEGINSVRTEIAVIKTTLNAQTEMLQEIRQTLKQKV